MDTNKELNKAFDVVINRINEIARRDNYSSGISYAIEVNYQSAVTNLPMSENTYGQFNHFKWTTWQWDYSWVFFDSIERAMLIVTDDEESYDDFYNDYIDKLCGVGFLLAPDFQHAIMLPINEWVEEELKRGSFLIVQSEDSFSIQKSTGIYSTPGVCGGDACIGHTRIPVWTLVNYRNLGASDKTILKSFPDLTESDLANAWAYADAYPEEIAQAIKENNEIME